MDSGAQQNFDGIQRKHIGRSFGRMVRVRLFHGIVLVTVTILVALLDGAPWRVAWVGALGVGAMVFFLYEARRYSRMGLTARSLPVNLWAGTIFQHVLLVGTGGIASPVLPSLLPLVFVGSVLSTRKQLPWLLAANLIALTGVAVAQLSGWLPGLPLSFLGAAQPAYLATATAVMCVLLVAVTAAGNTLRSTFDNMLSEALAHRDEMLATHLAHARELEALSGEIAHELKNPLATVKGLAQLMAREAGRSRPDERLEVLSSEVARMQSILEEFLNFSRPLVPLTVTAVDLAALCDEALVLHEGLAVEYGVRLERSGAGPVMAMCDPRKVTQVMMNLLHNAIEASPREGRVRVEVGTTGTGEARVCIHDEGPGLAPEVAGRAFEAGVTTKARGTGLGLTVARALARQHGGDVALWNDTRGGCVAELLLPRELPAGALGPVREVAHAS